MKHEDFMKLAVDQALKSGESKEVPVGCVFVYEGKVIGAAGNETNITKNATRHAELVAIDSILKSYDVSIFEKCSLYVTLEPCIMCASALSFLNIEKVYFGAHNDVRILHWKPLM